MIELHNDINRFIEHTADELKKYFITHEEIQFKKYEIGNLKVYVVYENKIRLIREQIVSYELKENGIILEKDNDFYYYNFKENYEKKEKIIKKFVEKYYLG